MKIVASGITAAASGTRIVSRMPEYTSRDSAHDVVTNAAMQIAVGNAAVKPAVRGNMLSARMFAEINTIP